MVIKTCKICGKEFDARGSTVTCSPECQRINQKNHKKKWREDNPEKHRESNRKYYEDNRDKILEQKKEWRDNNLNEVREYHRKYQRKWREANPEYDVQYREKNRDKICERRKEYYKANRDETLKKNMLYNQKIISELCEQYDGDLEEILANVPNKSWVVREAQMRVWFNESYLEGMIAKIESTPVCEVTGEKTNDLVIHHIYSFNTHPELGNDPANMVRITNDVHKKFHSIYRYGDNTFEQWMEFVENLDVKRGD